MLGFAVVLAISAASMGIAYLGFERVSSGVASYRHSVSEADLARNIDRDLISYRGLARYYVVTGKEDDGKAALAAESCGDATITGRNSSALQGFQFHSSGVDASQDMNRGTDHTEEEDCSMRDLEAITIRNALRKHNCNISEVSRTLGISRSSIYRKMRGNGIVKTSLVN